jgi:hypothetical protein
MAFTQEPDISQTTQNPETLLQKAITEELKDILQQGKATEPSAEYFILSSFGLDLAVFVQWQDQSSTRFLELKAFVGHRPGGVGFGDGKGEGHQVDLLLLDDNRLRLADKFIRWVIWDATKPYGTARFAILDNSSAKQHVMGDVTRGKQNNIRLSSLMSTSVTWDDLSKALQAFLLQTVQ